MKKRNLDLSIRKEGRLEKSCITPVIQYEISEIATHFDESLQLISEQFDVADHLIEEKNAEQAYYIWRAQIVFLESAFDFFMHELTKYGLRQIFDNHWISTKKYDNIRIDMKTVIKALSQKDHSNWFLEFINSYYSDITMVSFDSFKDQINLLGLNLQAIADDAFYDINASEKTQDKLKRKLNELYSRRNLIAHQSDRKHEDASIYDISKKMVEDFINDMQLIVNAVINEANQH